ncbi:RNA-directed DNA polymerase, eukaryota [Tanacetum coccineum]
MLGEVIQDFVSDERVVWVDIEGVPLYAWSRETFSRTGKKWGEMLNIEDSYDSSFGRKRVCIITKHPVFILESFKIIAKGKVFMVRAKELFTWNPTFVSHKEKVYSSDDDSIRGEEFKEMRSHLNDEEEGEFITSDVEGVADTIFGDNSASSKKYSENMGEQHSEDPFELYDLLKQKKSEVEIQDPSPSLSHPPGFTPVGSDKPNVNDHVIGEEVSQRNKEFSPMISAKVMNNSQLVLKEVSGNSVGGSEVKKGGSVLGVLEEMIRIGRAMGYSMEGCLGNKTKKEWVKELTNKNKINFIAIQETKMECISHMDVKFMWGNSNYDYVCSDSLGNSGGILCIWEESVFKKDYVTISDSFVAIYGTWIPNKTKILIVAIYAPQQPMFRRVLWDYMSILLSRWNGEAILMRDFNEVRTNDERRRLWFNSYNARLFNHFISSSGLVDIKMEGFEEKRGLGVSSFHALNRALLLKWVWRFVSQDDSLWFRVIQAVHGSMIDTHSAQKASIWSSILKEVQLLKTNGFDFLSYCSKRIGDGISTRFWLDIWKGDKPLWDAFPRLFALESNCQISVAEKLTVPMDTSFRRPVRGGVEQQQFSDLSSIMDSVIISSSADRWVCSLSNDGNFSVKEVRNVIDEMSLPSHSESARWVKNIPIKINIFAWRARRDCLPTRNNLIRKGVSLESSSCLLCLSGEEDVHHVFFRCSLARDILRRVCQWWDIDWQSRSLFS